MRLLILKIKKNSLSEKEVENKSTSKETSVSNGPKACLTNSVSELPSIKEEHLNKEQQPAKEEHLNGKQQPIKKEQIIEQTQSTKAEKLPNPETNRPVSKPSTTTTTTTRPKRAPKVHLVDESLLTTKYAPRSLEDIVGNQNNIRNLYNWLLQWDANHSSSSSFHSFLHRRSLHVRHETIKRQQSSRADFRSSWNWKNDLR